ncbi:TA system VapC family ribonuclease toxin [Burkholderia cenocepacia]|uniref:TA system VapC family ribonuclease toxin n=1 Tax=Burkholderia cenocepacia TaxID=95486 RepID=UPI000F5B85D1|nr:TA system VapC family ribonuclease toxin [Burkholderia cenocepacia]RQU83916.1 PIN domain-containing protein [Burkholderia cenocepacia]
MTYLLDVNVLIALLDPGHVQHDTAHDWFGRVGGDAWATCPLTENGVLRIIGNTRYPNTLNTPAAVAPLVAQLRSHPGHRFWPDDVSLMDTQHVDASRLLASDQVTDTYLLALARAHDGKLATFDRRLVVDAVPDGARHLELLA